MDVSDKSDFGCMVFATKMVGDHLILRHFSVGLPESKQALAAVLEAYPELVTNGFHAEVGMPTITFDEALSIGLSEGEVQEHEA